MKKVQYSSVQGESRILYIAVYWFVYEIVSGELDSKGEKYVKCIRGIFPSCKYTLYGLSICLSLWSYITILSTPFN